MSEPYKVLILTAGYGEGHNQVARTLNKQFCTRSEIEVEVHDLIQTAYPVIHSITSRMYLKSPQAARYGFDYYGWGYEFTRDSSTDSLWKKYFDEIGKKALLRTIRRFRPDVIINTFPFGAASTVGARLGIPVYTIVTDYVLHAGWIHPETKHYFVASESLRTELIDRGMMAHQVSVSGIPIRNEFEHNHQRQTNPFRNTFQKDRDLILIVAGSYGVLGQMEQLVRSMMLIRNCEIAVVCGKNVKLETKLRKQFEGQDHVHIFGFVEQLHQLMDLSTCMITKAGGITLTEAAARRLPLLIYRPFAGQESGNAQVFSDRGAAWVVNDLYELERTVVKLLNQREALQKMKLNLAHLHTADSATRIVQHLLTELRSGTQREKRSKTALSNYMENAYSNMLHV